MKKSFKYNPDISGLNIIDSTTEQQKLFFHKGHPEFLIPDFYPEKADIWASALDFIEKENDEEIYDQEGGEITYHYVDTKTGLTSCTYTLYDVCMTEDDDPMDINISIKGYVIDEGIDYPHTYFLATEVNL